MNTHSTGEVIFREATKEELKSLAARGQLAWKEKKVVLDPFTPLEFFYIIEAKEETFIVRGTIKAGAREEDLSCYEALFAIGALQHQIFRFWKEEINPRWLSSQTLTLPELKKLVDDPDAPPLVWKCPVPRWKPEPMPLLILKDRTGAFANLWMDYGPFGKVEMTQPTAEELFWEKDLLETDFIRKTVGATRYYCPLDKVVKTLTFLLDIGWTIIDSQGKKVVRQGASELQSLAQNDCILVKGRVQYGQHAADVQNVVGAFNRREKFVDLSAAEVGLLEFPPEWAALADEEIVAEGISVKRHHVGFLEGLLELPPEYQAAAWENAAPHEDFIGNLFDYQREGLKWLSYLCRSRFSGLLADEMGLGKTIQVIAFLSTLQISRPVLIVMPVSLLFHWKREFERFLPQMPVYLHRGPERCQDAQELHGKGVILTSYAQLRNDRWLESLEYEAVILDEAQAIKNPDTLTAQCAYRLKASFKLAMTGTPVENRYDDLWSLFRFLMPELLGERKESPIIERVRQKIRPFTLRRKKQEVALQLPEKQEQIVWVGWDEAQRDFYDNYLKEKKSALVQKVQSQGLSSQKMEILELILRLRQICCHPQLVSGEYAGGSAKFETVCNDLEEIVDSGHKVILYSQFTSVLAFFKRWLEEKGWRYAYLDGQTKDREKAVESFQTDPNVQVFLISLKAGGVGLNLQAADYVLLYDPWWNEAVEKQAIDRAHRVGRREIVIARKYITAESIEEKILKLQGQKQALAQNLLEFEGEMQPISLEELYALLG
jgi:SNF2 family DNA or RNA helicase